jgi:hypothetical protein
MKDGKRITYISKNPTKRLPSKYGKMVGTVISITNHWNHLLLMRLRERGRRVV